MQTKPLVLTLGIALTASATPTFALTISVVSTTLVESSDLPSQFDGPGTVVHSAVEQGNLGDTMYSRGIADVDLFDNSSLEAMAHENHTIITSSTYQVAQITNSSNTTQNLSFNFLIPKAYLETTIMYSWKPFTGGYYENASFSADIRADGVSIWNSAAELRYDQSGATLNESGTNLGLTKYNLESWIVGEAYETNAYNGLLNLGAIGANSTITLEYLLTAKAETNTEFYQALAGYGAKASIGDPFNFNNTPFFAEENFIANNSGTSVPEPSQIALIGTGLAALAFRRKNKK